MSTRLLTNEFEYVAPNSLYEALDLLSVNDSVKILAGGTDLLVKLKADVNIPFSILMDTKNISELDFVAENKDGLEIGALAKLSDVEKNPLIAKYHALRDALPLMASVAVRNMGTIGGNIANASPAADTACPMMVYDGVVRLASANKKRDVPLHDFFKGPGESDRKSDEMIVSFQLASAKANSGSCFIKKTRVKPDISKISVTAYVERDGDTIAACKLAMGSVAATPLFMNEIALSAVTKTASKELFKILANTVADTIKPIDDNRSTAEYRQEISRVLVVEALETAWTRAGGIL